MGATYVVVDNREDALTYFRAGMLHWWSEISGCWVTQDKVSDDESPPSEEEIVNKWWAILVEDEDGSLGASDG